MSNIQDPELKMTLERVKLGQYYSKFLEVQMLYCDLGMVTDDELKLAIPLSFHRKRLLTFLKSQKEKKETLSEGEAEEEEVSKNKSESEKEEERVHMFVKCKQEVRKIYGVPLNISNKDLITKLFHAFIEGEVKLQGEKNALVKELKSFTLRNWVEKNQLPPGEMIRAVLNAEGGILKSDSSEEGVIEEVEMLKSELDEVKNEKEKLKKALKRCEEEAKVKLTAEKEKSKMLKKELDDTRKALEAEKVEKKKLAEMENQSGVVPRGFVPQRGILVPQNVVFEVNEKYRSYLEKMFSNGNKVAKGIDYYACFKTSAVFTVGKTFYFEVSAEVGSGGNMGFGILGGEVTRSFVGDHEKGWSYHCYPGGTPKRTNHNKNESFGYGPDRTLGKHKFGIFCDFTDGKGEVSFIIDGKNWGVAYKNVEPPVSPAFYLWHNSDSFRIEEMEKLPDCF